MQQEALKRIGWIGTGVMGFHMCKHLISKGHSLSVYNRTASKAQGLLDIGAKWMEPKDLVKQSDIVILMLGYPKDVQTMVFGNGGNDGILSAMKPGSILIDHTTSTPNLAEQIYEAAKLKNIDSIDAPVSGGDVGAKSGKLVTMCGGDPQAINKASSILEVYSRSVQNNGTAGKGQHTKMANQIILAGNMAGMVEGLLYASKMGLDLNKTIQTISLGAASSTALTVMGPKIASRNYDPGFYVEHYVKDMEIALEEAARANLSLPCLSIVKQFYVSLKAQDGGRLGTQALIKVLEQMNNLKVGKTQEL